MSNVKSKAKGVAVIAKHVRKFQGIIDGLQKGIDLCEKEIGSNSETIDLLTIKNKDIEDSKAQASTFRTNLDNMLNVPPASEEKDEEEEKKEEEKKEE